MTLQEAREQRDRIRAEGTHCVVPLGHGPDGYFCRLIVRGQTFDLLTREDVEDYFAESARIREEQRKAIARMSLPRPRSPLEMMIDKACGLV